MSMEDAPGSKARAFGPTMKRLLGRFRPFTLAVVGAVVLNAVGIVFTVLGPLVLGQATNLVYEGWVSGRMEGGRSHAEVVADLRAAGDTTMADMVAAMEIVPGAGIDFAALARTLLLTLAVYLLGSLVMFLASRILNSVVQRVMYRLREDVESKIHALPLSHFDRMKRGDVLSRLTNDLDNLNQVLSESLGQIVMSLLTVVGVLAMMFTLSWQLTLVTLITVPLTALVIGILGVRSQRQFQAQWKATGVLNTRVEESITGHDLITVYGRDRVTKELFDAENDDVYRASFSAQMLAGLMMPAMQFIGNLVYVGIAVVGALQVASGQLRLGTVQAFIQYSRQFSQPLAQLGGMAAQLQSAAACAERVFELLSYPEETPDTGTATLPERPRGEIAFEHVAFGYSPDSPLITDLGLRAAPGTTTAIVGHTGAGKTTLVNLLMRFYEVDSGRITFDGVDIAELRRSELRSHMGMVLQDTWLFGGTIEENIAYGKPGATREEVVAAAEACYVDHVVRTLPDGYDTVIDDDGGNLSQGERQLITIARAFLTRPTVLILDEATSSVDTRTELLLQQAMQTLRAGRTSFVIAHRLSTIRDADTILVMAHGDIVEQGSHAELLQRGGAYAELHAAQLAAGGSLDGIED
ncbi:ABC transporter ATP-binding protein/permease [Brevibacterium sp. R8603A2]|uniref:ABC transporter ATP-binding protein n=1 Tax=Brevibacterium sp. R8603A2 TaxID=2929779 RepID=UPI001FF7ABFE|nr:ABC transporter ATP-binding protein [Brevibacterium sp. R8603A2]MCK1802485.1 ABC transporter ATP-binding protein/permease [Brevibacterium sp. R8603A2]